MQALWIIVAAFLFTIMGVLVKLASPLHGTAELVFWRGVLGVGVLFTWARASGLPLANPSLAGHLWRGTVGMLSLYCWYVTLAALPLALSVTINYTSTLFVGLVAVLLLRERPRIGQVAAILAGFGGVVLVLQPTLEDDQLVIAMIGLAGAFFASLAYTTVKRLAQAGEPEWRVVFYFSLACLLGGGALLPFDGLRPFTGHSAWYVFGSAVAALLAQFALTRAYSRGGTLLAATLNYSGLLFASGFGALLFGERIAPVAWLGMAIIVASGVAAAWAGSRRA
jgi:drug/metabolite transporter (DMT)-like permease